MSAMWTPPEIIVPAVNFTNGMTMNVTEWVDHSWAEEIQFMIYVGAVTGGPTTASLTATFQKRIPHKSGPIQYNNQFLQALSTQELQAWVIEGDWPNPLADQTTASPVAWTRNVRHFGPGINLQIACATTGGATPAFPVTVLFSAKGK